MSMLDKFRKGASKAGIQATAFLKEGGNKIATGSRDFAQGFSLPGEAEKAADILASFLGVYKPRFGVRTCTDKLSPAADPDHPESALNAIPKAVLQRARGEVLSNRDGVLTSIDIILDKPRQVSLCSPFSKQDSCSQARLDRV